MVQIYYIHTTLRSDRLLRIWCEEVNSRQQGWKAQIIANMHLKTGAYHFNFFLFSPEISKEFMWQPLQQGHYWFVHQFQLPVLRTTNPIHLHYHPKKERKKERKEGRKEGRKEERKKERKKERKEGRKEGRKEERKEGRKEGSRERGWKEKVKRKRNKRKPKEKWRKQEEKEKNKILSIT